MSLDISNSLRYKLQLLRTTILKGESLYSFAQRHNYGSSAINLLENSYITFDTSTELLLQANKNGFKHLKDNRNSYEYNLSLISGWIVEDYIVDNSRGILKLNGCDKDRKLYCNGDITNKPDLITYNGIPIEVHTEYFSRRNHFYNRKNCIRLRDKKYENLLNENAYLLVVNIPDNTYLLVKVSDFTVNSVTENPKYGGKLVYELTVNNIYSNFRPLYELFYRFNKGSKLQKETI